MTNDATKLYNPRWQIWDKHFRINDNGTLDGITAEGRVTIMVMRINHEERVKQRLGEMLIGDYPC